MDAQLNLAIEKATEVLHKACTPKGILALATDVENENYTRVWARDSIMTGYAGILLNDNIILEGLKSSLKTLADNQSPIGIIPSNVSISDSNLVSYGGTAGRVDATLWYIIGVVLYFKHTKDFVFLDYHTPPLLKSIAACDYWEFNHKHLIYTPLSGNWADEYPLHGYTLYDNCLRLWGLELVSEFIDKSYKTKSDLIRETIKTNFFITKTGNSNFYHSNLYSRTLESIGERPYPLAGFNPSRYYNIFDCGGNGLALKLGLFDDKEVEILIEYLECIALEISNNLTPAFWPVIKESDMLWEDIRMNYAYSFKNTPHHFHNGGIWPIMMGWLAQGLQRYDRSLYIEKMTSSYLTACKNEDYAFSEYIASDNLVPNGKSPLCYSAAGLILLQNATN